jgi:hypothetical protein
MNIRFKPVQQWPGDPTRERKQATFKATWNKTLDQLASELEHLRADDVLVQGYFRDDQISIAGWPKGGAAPTAPGIILTFVTRKHETFNFPCDNFTDWQDNLRAITLALESLRRIDRYGVTRHNEQYAGWKRLEAAGATSSKFDRRSAAQFLEQITSVPADSILRSATTRDEAVKIARTRMHPDKGGSQDGFVMVEDARKVLEAAL